MPPLDSGTRLAIDRTRLAYERTMMAWIRTAVSLISFGFTIYKFFQYEIKGSAAGSALDRASRLCPRHDPTALVSLAMAGIQHHESLRLLKQEYGTIPRSVAGPVAALVAFLGVCALISVIARL